MKNTYYATYSTYNGHEGHVIVDADDAFQAKPIADEAAKRADYDYMPNSVRVEYLMTKLPQSYYDHVNKTTHFPAEEIQEIEESMDDIYDEELDNCPSQVNSDEE